MTRPEPRRRVPEGRRRQLKKTAPVGRAAHRLQGGSLLNQDGIPSGTSVSVPWGQAAALRTGEPLNPGLHAAGDSTAASRQQGAPEAERCAGGMAALMKSDKALVS